ncbi:hypothetical protein CHU98_g10231 [Xylaria longipes]|nr:hypothetical protein CHU98_g10231 [Xylaria longipes]
MMQAMHEDCEEVNGCVQISEEPRPWIPNTIAGAGYAENISQSHLNVEPCNRGGIEYVKEYGGLKRLVDLILVDTTASTAPPDRNSRVAVNCTTPDTAYPRHDYLYLPLMSSRPPSFSSRERRHSSQLVFKPSVSSPQDMTLL